MAKQAAAGKYPKGCRPTTEWAFSLSPKLRLKPGLYYFTIERQEDGDMIYIGKFTVGATK